MAILTLEQLKKKHPNAVGKRIFTLEDIQRRASTSEQTQGNQFAEQDVSAPSKVRGRGVDARKNIADIGNLATSVLGGKALAEGLGKGLAAPGVQKALTEAEQQSSDIALDLVKRINQRRKEGKDTSRLDKALADLQGSQAVTRDVQTDFTESLPTGKYSLPNCVGMFLFKLF